MAYISYISYIHRLCFGNENQLISFSTQSQYLKTTPKSDLGQNKLGPESPGTDWIENEGFWACFRENDHFHAQTWIYKFGWKAGTIFMKWVTRRIFFRVSKKQAETLFLICSTKRQPNIVKTISADTKSTDMILGPTKNIHLVTLFSNRL
jgi:hypothetical protein